MKYKTKITYKCWYPQCESNICNDLKEKRLLKEELLKYNVEDNHIDFVCPYCERVIICKRKEKFEV